MKLEPDPVFGLPPGADQEIVPYGICPPLTVAVHVTGLPAVAVPQLTDMARTAPPVTVTVC